MIVTRDSLVKMKACLYDRNKFEAEFGESVEVTTEVLLRATEIGLDVGWWASKVLGWPTFVDITNEALQRYETGVKPARDAYYTAINNASRDQIDAAYTAWSKVCIPASEVYKREIVPAIMKALADARDAVLPEAVL